MKKIFFIILILFFSVTAHAGDWRHLTPGLDYKQIAIKSGNRTIFLNALKVNLKKMAVKPVFEGGNATAETFVKRSGALAVVNANFFDSSDKVLGLVKKDGKVINPKRDVSWWGVLCIKKDQAKIVATSNFHNDQCQQAFQTGPRLVVDGNLTKIKDEISPKTAVGITRAGEVVIVATSQFLSIQKLAQVMQASAQNGGLSCVDALNLDGGSSTQMRVAVGDFALTLTGYVKFPVGLGVFRKP